MRMVKRLAAILFILVFAASFAAAAAAQEQKNYILIGFTISSGRFEHESMMQFRGIQLWAEWVNSHGGIKVGGKTYYVKLVYYDDHSSKDLVQQLYEKLITQDHVNFLFSPYSSGLSMAAVPIAEKYHVPIIVVGAASDAIFTKLQPTCAFQIYTPASKYLASSVDLIREYLGKGAKVFILYEDSPFAAAAAEAAKKYAEELGLQVVGFEKYPKGTTNFASILERVRASGAVALIGGGHYQDGALLAKQIRQLGLDKQLKFVSLLVAPDLPQFYKDLGPAANGFAGPSQWEPQVKYTPELAKKLGIEWIGPTSDEFVKMFEEKYHMMPDYHAAGGFAAGLFLQAAIEKAGSIDPKAVCEAAKHLDILTFFGRLRVNPQNGLQEAHKMVLIQWQNGKKQIIWPKEVATAQPITLTGQPLAATATTAKAAATATAKPAAATPTATATATTTAGGKGGGNMLAIIIGVIVAVIVLGFLAWYLRARE